MSEYIIHIEDAKTLYGNADFLFPLDAYLREEIVRCRDCEYLEVFYPFNVYRMKQSETPEYHCTSTQFSNWDFPIEVEPDGFCAWGERE